MNYVSNVKSCFFSDIDGLYKEDCEGNNSM